MGTPLCTWGDGSCHPEKPHCGSQGEEAGTELEAAQRPDQSWDASPEGRAQQPTNQTGCRFQEASTPQPGLYPPDHLARTRGLLPCPGADAGKALDKVASMSLWEEKLALFPCPLLTPL